MSFLSLNLDLSSFFLRFWDPIERQIGYIVKLPGNMVSLENAVTELGSKKRDELRRVEDAERRLLKRTDHVEWWLKRVDDEEREMGDMRRDFEQMRCFGRNFRPNCWSSYKLGKRVMKKLTDVHDLINRANENSFDVVAVQPPPAAVEEMRGASALGMDPLLQKILRWLREDDNVGVIGIYGMGGVGKTTLLKKINNEFLTTLSGFYAVIWVVVSKEASIGKIQFEIGKKLGLSLAGNASDEDRARDIFRALSGKRIILLLDDIWKRVDLEEKVGIPLSNSQNKSKVVFTTRKEDVCGQMVADKKLKVEILGPQEALDLFKKNVGEEAMRCHPEIPALARSVAEECHGLPLALITIGRAMACKKTPQEWEHAISVLKENKAASEIAGVEDEVFFRLKFSYDTLDDTLKSCFLYCSLFPEDYHIRKKQLIDYWIAEGIININERDKYEGACNKGHDLIGQLKVACLLESGYDEEKLVKMHDVMRDLALWIASNKFLVQAGAGLREEPEVKTWMEAERVSLMDNDIQEITVTPNCPNLLTLLLQQNESLTSVNNSFFQHMRLLRVLDLSGTRIRELPLGICGLLQLRYLNLSCTNIRELPLGICGLIELRYLNLSGTSIRELPLGICGLLQLRYLNLSCTHIRELPLGICGLIELRYLNLSHTLIKLPEEMGKLVNLINLDLTSLEDPHIPRGVMSRLSMLRVLDLYRDDIKSSAFDIRELEELQYLTHLEIEISGDSDFQIFLQSHKLPKVTRQLNIKYLTAQTTSVQLSCIFGEVMGNLRDCTISYCEDLKELLIGADRRTEGNYSISKMESLTLSHLPDLSIIRLGWSSLQNLRELHIQDCHKLKNLTWILQLHNIQDIAVVQCNSFEEVIASSIVEVVAEALRLLKKLSLSYLPSLTSISNQARSFPSLTELHVDGCPELKKLNIHCNTDPRLKIYGKQEWWDDLEWEEESIRSHFLPLFKAGWSRT